VKRAAGADDGHHLLADAADEIAFELTGRLADRMQSRNARRACRSCRPRRTGRPDGARWAGRPGGSDVTGCAFFAARSLGARRALRTLGAFKTATKRKSGNNQEGDKGSGGGAHRIPQCSKGDEVPSRRRCGSLPHAARRGHYR
jgi:hypothetical protein